MAEPRSRLRNNDLNERSPLIRGYHLHPDQREKDSGNRGASPPNETALNSKFMNSNVETSKDLSSTKFHQSKRSFCRASCKRLPKGKGVMLVYFICFMETFAFFCALFGLEQIPVFGGSVWIFILLRDTTGRIVYPIAGLLADTYFGRYQVIHFGLWLLWIGFGLLALSQALMTVSTSVVVQGILPIASAIVISIGAGSVEVNTIPSELISWHKAVLQKSLVLIFIGTTLFEILEVLLQP